jgi:hypothetical protein
MFRESPHVCQIAREPRRRWFSDGDLELIIWLDKKSRIVGFQLCYEVGKQLKALTWHENDGFLHSGVDDGDNRPGRSKATPVLIPDATFDKGNIGKRFAQSSQTLPVEIADFVKKKIPEYNKSAQ